MKEGEREEKSWERGKEDGEEKRGEKDRRWKEGRSGLLDLWEISRIRSMEMKEQVVKRG